MITLASATEGRPDEFQRETFLGRSISSLGQIAVDWDLRITHQNSAGLPVVYNAALSESDPERPLVLIHDEASIQDVFLVAKLAQALSRFDIVGIAGGSPPSNAIGGWCDYSIAPWPMHGMVPHSKDYTPGSEYEPTGIICITAPPHPLATSLMDSLWLCAPAASKKQIFSLIPASRFITMTSIFAFKPEPAAYKSEHLRYRSCIPD